MDLLYLSENVFHFAQLVHRDVFNAASECNLDKLHHCCCVTLASAYEVISLGICFLISLSFLPPVASLPIMP